MKNDRSSSKVMEEIEEIWCLQHRWLNWKGGKAGKSKRGWAGETREPTAEICEEIMAERDVSKIKDRHPTTDLGSSESKHQAGYIAKNLLLRVSYSPGKK